MREDSEKTARWSSRMLQAGFTMVPNLVLLDGSLSLHAHRVYSLLLYFARQDESCWPGQDGLAEKAGCSERSVRSAIRELEEAGLVATRRRGRGRTNVYLLLVPRAAPAADLELRAAGGADLERHEVPIHSEEDAVEEDAVDHVAGEVPKVIKIDGRNLSFDAIAQVCGVPLANRARVSQMTAALKEIRGYFAGEQPELAVVGGEQFERQLAGEIVRRGRLYREKMPGATLTPTALAKWWHDCAPGDPKGSGVVDRV